MPGKRHTAGEIIHERREVDLALASGFSIGEIVRQLGVAEQSDWRPLKEYGGMEAGRAMRRMEHARENARRERLLADAHLDSPLDAVSVPEK